VTGGDRKAAIVEKLAQIAKLQGRSVELTAELAQSIRIAEVWPEAFKAGACTVQPSGRRLRKHLRQSGGHRITSAIIRRPDGETLTIDGESYGYIKTGERRDIIQDAELSCVVSP